METSNDIWSRRAIPLPENKLTFYSKSTTGPKLEGNNKPAFYILDNNRDIIGFEYDDKTLLFSNVTSDNGKILHNAKHQISKKSADAFIQTYANLYDDIKAKEKMLAVPRRQAHEYQVSNDVARELGKVDVSHYTKPLPKEHEHHFVKSLDRPNIHTGNKTTGYLIDKYDNIVGFEHAGKKFVFNDAVVEKGKILEVAHHKIKQKNADDLITDYAKMNPWQTHYTHNDKKETKPESFDEYKENVVRRAYDVPLKFKGFNRVYGEEYGIRPDSYRGASFLENRNRKPIGFRYHGKDFFINEHGDKLLTRYNVDMASRSHDIELVKDFIDIHLAHTNLGLKSDPYHEDVEETAVIMQDEIDQLKKQRSDISEKAYLGDKYIEAMYGPRVKQDVQDLRISHGPLADEVKELKRQISVLEKELETLSKPKFKMSQKFIMKQKEKLQDLKEEARDILEEASRSRHFKTIDKQLYEVEALHKKIIALEKSIQEDEKSGFEFIENPDDEFEIISRDEAY